VAFIGGVTAFHFFKRGEDHIWAAVIVLALTMIGAWLLWEVMLLILAMWSLDGNVSEMVSIMRHRFLNASVGSPTLESTSDKPSDTVHPKALHLLGNYLGDIPRAEDQHAKGEVCFNCLYYNRPGKRCTMWDEKVFLAGYCDLFSPKR